MRALVGLLVTACALSVGGQEPPASVSAAGGVGVAVSDQTATYPELTIEGDFPVYLDTSSVARVRARLELSGLPGDVAADADGQPQGLDLLRPETFRAAGAGLALARRVGVSPRGADGSQQSVYVEIVGEAWTRLVTRDVAPRDRLAHAITAGVRIERRNDDGRVDRYVSLRAGRSDIAAPTLGWGQVVVEGRTRLAGYHGVDVVVGARVDADVRRSAEGRDRFTVSVQVLR